MVHYIQTHKLENSQVMKTKASDAYSYLKRMFKTPIFNACMALILSSWLKPQRILCSVQIYVKTMSRIAEVYKYSNPMLVHKHSSQLEFTNTY